MLPILQRKEKSTTQCYSPKYRKACGNNIDYVQLNSQKQKQNVCPDSINFEYSSINIAMEKLECVVNQRMGTHERELLDIMKKQIASMLEDIRKAVIKFNKMMKQKNFSEDLWQTKNEVEYFKFEAVRLFQENNLLRNQIHTLKNQIGKLNLQEKCQSYALKRIAKKLVKQKAERKAFSERHCEISRSVETCMKQIKREKDNQALSDMTRDTKKQQYHVLNLQSNLKKQSSMNSFQRSVQQEKKTKNVHEFQDIAKVGYSERLTFLNSTCRKDKMKQLKQKQQQCRSGFHLKELLNFERDEKKKEVVKL